MDIKDDSTTEFFQFDGRSLQVAMDGMKNLQCCKSWEMFPVKFNWFSIHSQQLIETMILHSKNCHLAIPLINCFLGRMNLSQGPYESEWTYIHFDGLSLSNVDLVHEGLIQSRHLTFRISQLSIIKLLAILNRLSISSNSEFLDTSGYSMSFGSKCPAAFIDNVINHHHINILVLQASMANPGRFCTPANLFCKFRNTFFMNSVFVTSTLRNSGLVLFSCVRVLATVTRSQGTVCLFCHSPGSSVRMYFENSASQ